MLKLINDVRKETDVENPRITELEKKIDEIEDALDEFAKLVRIAKASNCLRFSINNRLRSSHPEVFCKKDVLRSFAKLTGKHLCQSLFFNKVAGLDASKGFMKAEAPRPATLLKKKTQAQVFSCEFCEISKNTIFHRTPLVAASALFKCAIHNLFQCTWRGYQKQFIQYLQQENIIQGY